MRAASRSVLAVLILGLPTAVHAQVFAPNPALTFSAELTIAEVGELAAFNADPDGGTPATTGRTNLALAANGGVGFESSRIAASYGDDKLNNGVYGAGLPDIDDGTRPWINSAVEIDGFAGVALSAASTVGAIGFGSRFPSRSDGLFTLQVTTDDLTGVDLEDLAATGALGWSSVGNVESTTGGEFGRHVVQFTPVDDVTAVRIVVSQGGTTITEIEAYASVDVVFRPPELGPQADPTAYTQAILADGPIHYYRFEETAAHHFARDEIGDQHGLYSGGSSFGGASATGVLGSAATFNGLPGSFIDLGTPFHPGPTMSVEAWVNLDEDSTVAFAPIAARWDGSFEIDFNESSGKLNFVTRNEVNTFSLAESEAPFTKGEWHHVVGVFENGITTVYLNGVQGTSVDVSDTGPALQDAGATLLIGSTRDGNAFNWKGVIDEVAFYDYALSEVQVAAHFAAASEDLVPQIIGDCNQDGDFNVGDIVCGVGLLFPGFLLLDGGGLLPPCGLSELGNGAILDVNGDLALDLADVVYAANYLFGGGPPPVRGAGCVGIPEDLGCLQNQGCQ